MICENPYTGHGVTAYPCGACIPCRIRRKQIWKTRLILEGTQHRQNCFVTLTYRDDQIPLTPSGLPTLIRSDLSDWLKRLRIASQRKIDPQLKLRFYAVGEYGDKTQRPHYHAILFGYPPCAYGCSRYRDGRTIDCCAACDLIRDTWKKGIIENKPFAPENAAYVAGYVMKKMTSKHDTRLNGRYPEFPAMSLRPGIGAHAAKPLAQDVLNRRRNDVSLTVRINGKEALVGRYIRKLAYKELGWKNAPEDVRASIAAQMLPLLQAATLDPENITLKQQIIARCRGEVASLKARQEIYNSRNRGNL